MSDNLELVIKPGFGIIYIATCLVNDHRYIGKSKGKLRRRKIRHIRDAKNGSNLTFHKALRKHGPHNFVWKILVTIEWELLDPMEIDLIALYKSKGFILY